MGVEHQVLNLEPADLRGPVPAWELAVEAGVVPVVVIDGTGAEWEAAVAAAPHAWRELRAAPALTVAVVRDGQVWGAPAVAVHSCDVILEHDCDARLERLLERLEGGAAPALVAAMLLRDGDSRIANESFAYSMLLGGHDFGEWRRSTPAGAREEASNAPRVEIEETGIGATIRLTRPQRHNAYDARMREQLCDALDAVTAARARTVVLLGAGPSFCSGGDLDEFGLATDPVSAHVVRTGRSVARRLDRIADRLVVGVHGHCIGAGVELAAFGRAVIAAEGTQFVLPELALGLNLGAGGSTSIPRRIGRHRTLELLLTGAPLSAERAAEWGLVDELVPVPLLERRCLAVAAELR